MIENHVIICFASGYDAPPTSKHHVMHLLAERNIVLWVNYHASRAPSASVSDLSYMFHKLRTTLQPLRKARPNLFVTTPLVIPLPGSNLARRLNRRLLVRRIRAALRQWPDMPVQVWSFAPDINYLLGSFGEKQVVYYCVDDFASFTGYDGRQVLADEEQLCRRADVVVTTSMDLWQAKQSFNARTLLVRHGVDYEHFARAVDNLLPAPSDLAAIPRPRLGFIGLIRDWVDLDLIAAIARRRPMWQFVFIGDSVDGLIESIHAPNVHYLGRKRYEDLPAYCANLDVGLIPFRINELTRAVNPIKLREYLAAGLPVVSTPLPEVAHCGDKVHIASGPETFMQAIEKALAVPAEYRSVRSAAMSCETWPAKIEEICRHLQLHQGQEHLAKCCGELPC